MSEKYKGIVLAGGSGTRLHPLTVAVSKQMLPVYDKPMIYYPISVLMMAGIRDILLISTPRDIAGYKNLLGSGEDLGISIHYSIQDSPEGLPQAFTIGEAFIGDDNVALILGDNLFFGEGFQEKLQQATSQTEGATVFGYYVGDPERYGVVEFDDNGQVVSIEEKPDKPKSNCIITGLYFYDNNVIAHSKSLEKSSRGEFEITDVNNIYCKSNSLKVVTLGRGFAWLDTGTHESLADATQLVRITQNRHGLKLACLEEIAFSNGWLTKQGLISKASKIKNRDYADYLIRVAEGF